MTQPIAGKSMLLFATPEGRADFERFTSRLVGLARVHLDARMQQKVDPEDLVQSAYKSFFIRYGNTDVAAKDLDELWSLLTLITLRKCADRARFFNADRRDLGREVAAASVDDTEVWRDAIGREPTPEHAAAMAETVEQLLADLTPDDRPIMELSLQGYSVREVSEQLGRAERSVRRLRERLRKQLERMQSDHVD